MRYKFALMTLHLLLIKSFIFSYELIICLGESLRQHFLHRKGKTLLCMFTIIPLLFNIAIVRIGVASPNQTKAWVDPPSILDPTLVPGKNFTINVNVFNVTNLYSFEVCLLYNTTILDGLSVELPPGHFLTPVDPTKILINALEINDTYTDYTHTATHGRVWADVTLSAPEQPKNGSGTLVTITFNATALGECDLDLGRMGIKATPYGNKVVFISDKIKLYDRYGDPIEHEAADGYFSNKIPGDVDGDGDVDDSDLSDFSGAYGSEPADPNCDFNKDDVVDALDLFDLSKNYGKTVP